MSIDAAQTLFVKVASFFYLIVTMGQLKRKNKSKLIQDKASRADEKPGLELPNLWNLVELL